MYIRLLLLTLYGIAGILTCHADEKEDVIRIIHRVNRHWQQTHVPEARAFWDEAVYHTGNMEAYFLTKDSAYLNYSLAWAEHNQWMGAKSEDKSEWLAYYGENDRHVLFGDWQICFQTYIDLYTVSPDPEKISRAREVMEYQMSTSKRDYWYWVDALYMVMPVMTKMYKVTHNAEYLEKLHLWLSVCDSIMLDGPTGLYFRDAKYLYPQHQTKQGKKDFWSRGNGWAIAAFAKVLKELPADDKNRSDYAAHFTRMAQSMAICQTPEGYWTRSLLDKEFAPGPETSGTALTTYALLWGVNSGWLDRDLYADVIGRAWNYLYRKALQSDGSIGYIQPIGEKAIPGQVVDALSTYNFGVGAFLLAACEYARYIR